MPSVSASERLRLAKPVAAALILLAAAGLAIRLHGITQPLVLFHPLRHYRSALIARDCYDRIAPGVPDWARTIARDNRELQPEGEPPLMEWVACGAYRVTGGERLEIPRTLVALIWVVGVWPLVLLTTRFVRPSAAVLAGALYLFLPYAVTATRTFQPDALMTLATLCAALAAVRAGEERRPRRLAVAAVLLGAALLLKPMSVFVAVPAVLALITPVRRLGRLPIDRSALVIVVLGLVPAVAYYGYGALFGTLVRDQFQTRFVPSLLPTSFFWRGWLTQIVRVAGWPAFVAAVAGTVIARRSAVRRLLVAWWIGYAAFAIAFTYHIPTHDYYHLPYVAVFAFGAAAAVDAIGRWTPGRAPALVAIAASVAVAVWGPIAAWPKLTIPGAERLVATYEHIGDLTHHDGRVLFLDLEYGYPLMYHGQMSGDTWPDEDDLDAERLSGEPSRPAAERFDRGYARWQPHYFVATDLDSFDAERDLQALLAARADLVEQGRDFRVYRFRGWTTPGG